MTLERDIRNVLPSFRTTRRDMWRWDDVAGYAREAEQGAALLADMAEDYGAAGVIPVVQKAIASTFTVLMRADDSGGMIQLVISDLLNLHAELCAEEPPSPAVLSTWILKQQFGEIGDYFEIDVSNYEEALGERGLATFERHLAKRWEALTTPFDDRPELEYARDDESGARDALLYNLQRLAVMRGDEGAIIRTHGGDLPRAHLREDAAKALCEAGLRERAAAVAHEGMTLQGGVFQQVACGALWRDILAEIDSPDAEDAAREVFSRWPSDATARAWSELATDWSAQREGVLDRLREKPRELVAFLMAEGDVQRAWDEATATGQGMSVEQWDDLIAAYATIDPIAVLPVMAQLIDGLLVEANTRIYPRAVKRMRVLRKDALAAGRLELATEFLTELRARYARRPSLISRMDAARV